LRGGAEHYDGLGDDLAHVPDEQHRLRQPLHQAGRIGPIAGADRAARRACSEPAVHITPPQRRRVCRGF
jgi:hypothetical protein